MDRLSVKLQHEQNASNSVFSKWQYFRPCCLSVPLQSSSISVTFWASLTMGTLKSEGPQPSCVEPSYRQHSPKHVTMYTAGWPVCKVQQVSVWRQGLSTCTGVFVSTEVLKALLMVLSHMSFLLLSRQPSVPGGLGAFATENSER